MTPILDRLRANGGDALRVGWRLRIRRGRLSDDAMSWVRDNRPALMREVWDQYDLWEERAAIREFDGGQGREEANNAAYDEVMGHA